MKFKVIILDFDGVVIESNKIKHEAFSEIFSDYPEYYDKIMAYHYAHNHVDRHKKFKYFITNILNQPFAQALADRLAERFAQLTREKIINCPYVAGALDFIREFSTRFPMYIASATPLDELMIILEARRLNGFFKGIYGAPMPKQEIFKDVIQKEQIRLQEVVFIGDSPEDYQVAKEAGIFFIGRMSDAQLTNPSIKIFSNVAEIKTYLLKECVAA